MFRILKRAFGFDNVTYRGIAKNHHRLCASPPPLARMEPPASYHTPACRHLRKAGELAQKTYKTLQAGRGLAALAVAVHHAADYLGGDPRFWMKPAYMHALYGGALGVDFFFVLSGIVILLAHWRDQGDPSRVGSYTYKRFRRIYPVYWCVFIPVAAAYLFSNLGHGFEKNNWVLLSSFLLVHIHSIETTLHVGWTLFHEVLFYSFFALILLRRRLGYAMLTIWLTGSLVCLAGAPMNLWFKDYLFFPIHLDFALGMLVVWLLKTHSEINWWPPALGGSLILGYAVVRSGLDGATSMTISLLFGLGSAALLLGLMEIERRDCLNIWPSLVLLGDASYAIYLVHFPVLSICMRFLYAFSKRLPPSLPVWLWLIPSTCIAMAAGLVLHLAVERPLLWLIRPRPRSFEPTVSLKQAL